MLTKIFYHILGLLVAFCLLFAVLITVTETLLYRVDGYFAKEYQKYAVTERVDMRLSDLLSVTDEMMDYLKGDRENLNVEAVIGGVQREFFNACGLYARVACCVKSLSACNKYYGYWICGQRF